MAYLDNVLVYLTRTLEEYKEHVKKVLARLKEHALLVHLDKSEFHKIEMKFLGFIILREGIIINKDKVLLVKN